MFKVGDEVRVKRSVSKPKFWWGPVTHDSIGVVTEVFENKIQVNFPEHGHWNARPEELELINPLNPNSMNLKESFSLIFKSEPQKSFRKAEITNELDRLTEDGRDIFLLWLLDLHGEEFKKEVVDKLLKEEK